MWGCTLVRLGSSWVRLESTWGMMENTRERTGSKMGTAGSNWEK